MTDENKSQTVYRSLWDSLRTFSFFKPTEEDLDVLVQKLFDSKESSLQEKKILRRLSKKTEYDKDDLCKAKESITDILKVERRELLLPIADAIRYINTGFTDNYDLTDLLSRCANSDFEMSEERVREFALRPLNTEYRDSRGYEETYGHSEIKTAPGIIKKFKIYLDTPASVALMHCGEPKALVSVLPVSPSTMMIYQLQGVKPEIKSGKWRSDWRPPHGGGILGRFDWKRLMVGCAEQVAADLGYSVMAIQGAKNNRWNCGEGSAFGKRAALIYDATAEMLGYVQREDGNWYKTADKR